MAVFCSVFIFLIILNTYFNVVDMARIFKKSVLSVWVAIYFLKHLLRLRQSLNSGH